MWNGLIQSSSHSDHPVTLLVDPIMGWRGRLLKANNYMLMGWCTWCQMCDSSDKGMGLEEGVPGFS